MRKIDLVTDPIIIRQILSRGVENILPEIDNLIELMTKRPIRVYLGIDPTGNQLTLGHGVVLRKLQQFAELGHEVILLVGNGTVKIGDPTGRDSTRPVLTNQQIESNFTTWKNQASKILDFNLIQVRYNDDWLAKIHFPDFIKLLAQTTVQQLLERDMFQERLKNNLPIFGHEIIYPLIQGYDSVAMDIDLEIGGNDQLFNMMMGRHLQRQYNQRDKWVLTTPIINGTDGRKMSKSYSNYISLTEEPVDMYGKIMSLSDEQIIPYLAIFSDISESELTAIKHALSQGENPMQIKKSLAYQITQWLHNTKSALLAQETFEQVVQKKNIPEEITNIQVTNRELSILDLTSLCCPNHSRSQLRRLVEQRAVTDITNQQVFSKPLDTLTLSEPFILKIGKRDYFRVSLKT